MSSLELQQIALDDALPFARSVSRNFYEDESDEELDHWVRLIQEPELDFRGWVVRDGEQLVANYGIYSMDVSTPGGGRMPMAGVTAVGVAQTHRRRGLLNRMMVAGLDDAAERGEPVAMLYASESIIYGRYGFGVVAPTVGYHIDRSVTFRDPVDTSIVVPAAPEQALAEWPSILESVRDRRPGCATRSPEWWRRTLVKDPESWRDGASARRLVHVPGRGYASFRVKDGAWKDNLPDGTVRLGELVAADAEAEAALWQFVCDIDLTSAVAASLRPPDCPLPELVTDRLRLRTKAWYPLYARLLDVQKAFEGRTYAATAAIVLDVGDPTRDQSGTWLLDASPDGVSMTRTDRDADLSLPIDALASVWLGGVRAVQLAGARRLVERRAGAAAELDRLVATDLAPWNPFEF
ncbi:GNAT family N-acetyltransferase [Egicoccus sp. AB-alg6-2]|uniref:GNAT family N-acetyltransferase n=1 Tax=Egicoccus sp. AB-alg6-2 TaxID=3242692 RepID=UPI00359E6155